MAASSVKSDRASDSNSEVTARGFYGERTWTTASQPQPRCVRPLWRAAADRRACARACAAPMKSRKSGAGRVRPGLELRMELAGRRTTGDREARSPRPVVLLEGARDDEPGLQRAADGSGCSPRSGGGGARRSRLAVRRIAFVPRRARRRVRAEAHRRRPCPRPPSARAAGRSTGYGRLGSNSLEFAPSSPRHVAGELDRPRPASRGRCRGTGSPCSRAYPTAAILPSIPRPAEAAGTRECRPRRRARASPRSLDASPRRPSAGSLRCRGGCRACFSASATDRYASCQLHVLADERDLDAPRRAPDPARPARPTPRGRPARSRARASRRRARRAPPRAAQRARR